MEWFEKFAHGFLKWMGQIVRSDLAFSIMVVLELMVRLDSKVRGSMGWAKIVYLMVRGALAIKFAGSLRGHEFFLADLHGMRKNVSKGRGAASHN